MQWKSWLVFASTLAAITLVTAFAPLEATLGERIRLVYLHGAWVWAGKISFACAALAGLAALITRATLWKRWTLALGRAGLVVWLTYLPMSLVVQQSNWGGIFGMSHAGASRLPSGWRPCSSRWRYGCSTSPLSPRRSTWPLAWCCGGRWAELKTCCTRICPSLIRLSADPGLLRAAARSGHLPCRADREDVLSPKQTKLASARIRDEFRLRKLISINRLDLQSPDAVDDLLLLLGHRERHHRAGHGEHSDGGNPHLALDGH